MNYYQEFDYVATPWFDALGAVLGFLLVFYLLIALFGIVAYVLQSLGMYTIATRRGIRHAWLAWLPVGNMWILGSISDQYQYLVKGRVCNRRKVLLWMMIVPMILSLLLSIALSASVVGGITGMESAETLFGVTMGLGLIAYLVVAVLCVVAVVIQFMALYDLYISCEPSNGVLYLILSIFVSVVMPFFVFACRKKDLGMPPRRTQEAEIPMAVPVEEAYAEVPCDEEVSPEEAFVMGMEIEENKENPPVEE